MRHRQRAEHTGEIRSRDKKEEESSELWTETVTRAAEPTAAAGHHQKTWAVLHISGCSQGNFNKNKCHKMQEGRRKNKGSCQSTKVTELLFFFSCGSGSVLERKRYVWRKATKAHSTLAEENSPADHKRTHAEIARKGQQRSQDTGTLHWNRMKDSAACLCKAEGRFSKHTSGWSKPPTIISGEIQKIKTKKKLENPTTKQGS